jgi:aminoglycoside phosphotransferase (APT) family kinase protein
VREVDSYGRALGARDVVMPVLAARLDRGAYGRVEAWWASFAEDGRMQAARRAVCHHDLWHENLLRSDDGRLSGVLDIAHVEIGDPAHDFAAPRYFVERAYARVVAAYRSAGGRFDAEDEHRAQRFHEAREFGGLAWAVEHDDAAEIDEAIGKISRGPVLHISRGE